LIVYLKNRFAAACLKTKKMIFSGMTDFKDLKDICRENSEMIHSLVEEFLVYYAASKENLEREMNERLSRYRHITREFKDGWVNLIGYNGACRQSFGPIGAYKSIQPDIRVNLSMIITAKKYR
jgi:hypothetical protein